VDVRTLASPRVALIGGALIAVALGGKFLAGFSPWWFRGRKSLVGVAMIPRGEVGLIFAQMGLGSGALDVSLFSAIALMVMVSTLVAPPLLGVLTRRAPHAPHAPDLRDRPGDGGIDDLVAGAGSERER
jgi:Kef-type K+ transport system membrane component KefB